MKASQLIAALAGGLLAGCTGTDRSEHAATTGTPAAAANEQTQELAEPKRCNDAVVDAAAAIELAESARRSAGFLDMGEVESPKKMITAGFLISPMVPSRWPASDCMLSFYVFKAEVYADNSVYFYRHPVTARIDIRLDTGAVDVVNLGDGPGAGGRILYPGMLPRPDQQQWIFDVVVTSTVPESPGALTVYREWLHAEEFVAAALYVWHREFFEFVVRGDADIMREVEANTRPRPARQRTNADGP